MPKLSKLYAAEEEITLTIADEPLTLRVRPGIYTQAYEEGVLAASRASGSPTGVDDQNRILCDLVVSWDLEDDTGVIPLTRDALAQRLPFGLARELVAQLVRRIAGVGEAPRSARQ